MIIPGYTSLFRLAACETSSYGIEELNNLDLKSRFTIFERASSNTQDETEFSEDHKFVKRSESILSKLARFVILCASSVFSGIKIFFFSLFTGSTGKVLCGVTFPIPAETWTLKTLPMKGKMDTLLMKAVIASPTWDRTGQSVSIPFPKSNPSGKMADLVRRAPAGKNWLCSAKRNCKCFELVNAK